MPNCEQMSKQSWIQVTLLSLHTPDFLSGLLLCRPKGRPADPLAGLKPFIIPRGIRRPCFNLQQICWSYRPGDAPGRIAFSIIAVRSPPPASS
ncbi:unnamed protein product [Protopolystoma xenopodis]|uniref:Uncharacterized protein n=1 Tax=Protopolystoma xenopodis TaxID=117903 RepID=A0A3S5BZA6_9PLAT|nr:unnamed protein product [Protopolystoma xenopodis]